MYKDVAWEWTTDSQQVVNHIKKEIIMSRFLTLFPPELSVKLICGASSMGLKAVLAHVMPNDEDRLKAFATRSLNQAEKNYSQTEKEVLALIYGAKKYHINLYGQSGFPLVMDDQLLLAILTPKSRLCSLVTERLHH